ncbi:MAG: IPT/TIG domain-containing protein, partial [Bacteroidota bacterium]
MKSSLPFFSFLLCGITLLFCSCEEDTSPPIITAVTPEFGAAEDLIIFEGMHLSGIKTLTFNGEVTNFNTAYNSDIALLFRIPTSMEIGDYEVVFTTDGGSTSVPFRVTLEAPQIFSFSESAGGIGDEITIYGKNFFDPLEVYFPTEIDSISAELISRSSDSIKVVVPEGAIAGFVTLVANGGATQSPTQFSVVSKIQVNDFDGNGLRANTDMWSFLPGSATASWTITDLNPSGIDGNFLKLK